MKRSQRRVEWMTALAALAACLTSPLSAQVAGIAGIRSGIPISVGPFELNTSGTVDQIASPTRPHTALSIETSLRAQIRSGGVWIGSALEGAHDIDTIPIRPLLRFGVWQSFNAIRVAVAASSHTARLGGRPPKYHESPVTDSLGNQGIEILADSSGEPSKLALWSEVESQLSWRVSRATLSAVVGARPDVQGFRPSVWGHLGATYELSPYVALVGAAGSDAPRIALGIPAVRYAGLALRVGAWTSSKPSVETVGTRAFVVRSVGSRRYTVIYQAPDAQSVELSGDFDGWKPTAFTQTRPGVWEATVHAAPGTYRVNLRVNGGSWFAPPGLPQTEDDFNGTVGILVLR